MNVIERTRASGKCPPSLFRDEPKEGSFEAAVANVLDANELALTSGVGFMENFKKLMEMASNASDVPGDKDTQTAILVQRRAIILAIVGATPSSSSSLALILRNGYLNSIKSWLDDILSGSVGGIDLLLHLLSNIIELPVTKSAVKESGMGKAIGSLEKHKICVGSPNEAAVRDRVRKIKAAWNNSVKALADKTLAPVPKRAIDTSSLVPPPAAKKLKTEERKGSSFSSLLRKVGPGSADFTSAESADATANSKMASKNEDPTNSSAQDQPKADDNSKAEKKKQLKRVKWQDHFGGDLADSRTIEGGDLKPDEAASEGETSVSWTDRKRRDRLREKELLAKVKKSKLMDDDDDVMGMDTASPPAGRMIQTTIAWNAPNLLQPRADAPPPQVNSTEIATQTARMTTVRKAQYASLYDVPSSPAPMSDVEQALDMTNQSSTATQTIPFFVPQQIPEPAAPVPAPAAVYGQHAATPGPSWAVPPQPAGLPPMATAATPEFVQSLGLPMFLVGQDTQALQTLASTPSLLSTFVDSNGMYDQPRLTSLVQTLSQNSKPSSQPLAAVGYPPSSAYSTPGQSGYAGAAVGGIYGPASGGSYGPAAGVVAYDGSWQGGGAPRNGHREQRSDEGNLHLSGYGPTTTQVDIINLFSPYVRVDEVVMKGTFSFVNTSDPEGAQRAREALSGALLGGSPIRINVAQRKKRNDGPSAFGSTLPTVGSFYGAASQPTPGISSIPSAMGQGAFPPVVPPQAGPVDVSNVRDDRGNPATKNLFVAGYGQGTTELQLRDLFGQYAQIIGIIMKGTFSFVNTSDRAAAVRAREVLSGTMFNGGTLRINFAKESGRLGTSFDVTYNNVGGSHAHYGRH